MRIETTALAADVEVRGRALKGVAFTLGVCGVQVFATARHELSERSFCTLAERLNDMAWDPV